MIGWWWGDPGPCPVDDKPHTTCTSADYNPNDRGGIVIVQLPARDGVPTTSTSFTTATYRGTRPRPLRKR